MFLTGYRKVKNNQNKSFRLRFTHNTKTDRGMDT